MRKQTQLADLIAGSGLVSGAARRAASQDGTAGQPALYHFGAGPGGSGSGSTGKEHRHRPPLPAGASGAVPGPGLSPAKAAWSSPHASPAKITGAPGTPQGSASGSGYAVSNLSSGAALGVAEPVAGVAAATTPPAAPLPLLEPQRADHRPEGYEAHGSHLSHASAVLLPAVAGFGPGAASLLPGGPGPSGAGTSVVVVPDSEHGVNWPHDPSQVQHQHQHGHLTHHAPPSTSSPQQLAYAGQGQVLQGGSGGVGPGHAGPSGLPNTWQHMAAYPRGIGGTESAGGCSPHALASGRGSPGGRPRGGGAGHAAGHLGAGGRGGKRVGRPSATGAAPTSPNPPSTAALHRSSSDSAVRSSGSASHAAWVAYGNEPARAGAAFSATGAGAAEVALPSPSSPARSSSSLGAGASVGAVGVRGSAVQLPAIAGHRGPGAAAGSQVAAPSAGATEVLVVTEESSEPVSIADTDADGWGGFHGAAHPPGTQPGPPRDSATGSSTCSTPMHTAAMSAEQSAAPVSAPHHAVMPGLSARHSPQSPATWAAPPTQLAQPGQSLEDPASGNAAQAPGTISWPGPGSVPGVWLTGAAVVADGAGGEVAELRRLVAELQGQVSSLTLQLRDSELAAAQLQSMAAAAAVSGREAAEAEAARKHMKALKSAEAARDKAELARRGAEKRARAAEEELAVLKEKLEAKSKQALDLEAAVAAAQASLERQRRSHEEALGTLEAELRAQARKLAADAEAEKKGVQDSLSKLQVDMARRNQLLLELQADLEIAQREGQRKDAAAAELQHTVERLEEELQKARDRMAAERELRGGRAAEAFLTASASSPRAGSRTPRPDPAEASGSSSGANAAASASAAAAGGGGGGSLPSPAATLRRGGSVAAAAAVVDEHTLALRKMQTEVAAIREAYAQRVVGLEEVVNACEAAMRDGLQGLDRMFGVLVSRTAGLLAGRLGGKAVAATGTRPGATAVANAASLRSAVAAAAAAASSGPGPAAAVVLHQMNEKLAAENATLLGELARWQSGRHVMLRKLGMTVLGAEPAAAAPPPLTHQQQIAQALAAVTGQQHHGPAASAGQQHRQSTPGSGAPVGGGTAASPSAAPGTGSAAAAAGGGGTGPPPSPAREALAAAAREVLLAGRRELLPAVMTAEGWGEGGDGIAASLHGGRAEAALAGAEASVRLRAQVLALQSEVARLRAAGGEATERGRDREAMSEAHEAALAELRRELGAAKQHSSHLQRELERARAGIQTDARPAGLDSAERERLEDAAAAAREEASRHKAAAAAAKREAEARERQVEEGALRQERLEAQLRDARSEADRQAESVRRLRQLLAAARGLLREAGIPFMEDDPGDPGAGPGTPSGRGGKGGRGGLPPRPGSASGRSSDGDGPLFKALDAREREKEMSRLSGELADVRSQLATAQRELKKARKQLAAAAEAATAAEREQRARLADTIEGLAREGAAAKEAAKAAQKQLQELQHEAGELRRQLVDMGEKLTRARLDGDYLRARAAAGKMKPRLSHARALSMSISSAAAAAAPGPAEG